MTQYFLDNNTAPGSRQPATLAYPDQQNNIRHSLQRDLDGTELEVQVTLQQALARTAARVGISTKPLAEQKRWFKPIPLGLGRDYSRHCHWKDLRDAVSQLEIGI